MRNCGSIYKTLRRSNSIEFLIHGTNLVFIHKSKSLSPSQNNETQKIGKFFIEKFFYFYPNEYIFINKKFQKFLLFKKKIPHEVKKQYFIKAETRNLRFAYKSPLSQCQIIMITVMPD